MVTTAKGFIKYIISLLITACLFVQVQAQEKFDAAALLQPRTGKVSLVNDYAGILTAEQKIALEQKLVQLDDSSFTQIAIVIVPDLNGRDVADYATELGRAWGVGGKEFNNGVVLLISKEDRKLNISTGYGLEGSLTDATANAIIQDVIVPNFKGDDYYRGIDEGTDAIISAVKGTYNTARPSTKKTRSLLPFIIIALIIIFLISRNSGGGGGTFMSRRGHRGFGGPFIFPGAGGFGGFGGGGGGSSGGFGGFGGGSFGGGGSSGSW